MRFSANPLDKVATGSYHWLMKAIGIKNLKNHLSEYVRLAASGETVLVTERDRVVAELVPPQAGRAAQAPDALLADAVRKGWLTPPLSTAHPLPRRHPVSGLQEVLSELSKERNDR